MAYVTIQFNMSELRQNIATKEWVIIATERAQRPEEFGDGVKVYPAKEKNTCPFCCGHENRTPPEITSFRSYGTVPNSPGWWVRVVPNQFPALKNEGNVERHKIEDFFVMMPGFGEHEVVIESPEHDQTIATMEQKQVEEIFLAYLKRHQALSQDKRHEMVIVFKNHGSQAGTSLHHPHSQIIATPVTPNHIRHRIEEAMRYFDDNGHCVYCEMIDKELKAKDRIVVESANFVVFEPFASRSPFETWVIPKFHSSDFSGLSEEMAKELAFVTRHALLKIYKALRNPDYNYMIYSGPSHECELEYYHWYIKILPRVTSMAGFELGSGIYINTVIPESAAKFLRETPSV